jgi:hypothetical protein
MRVIIPWPMVVLPGAAVAFVVSVEDHVADVEYPTQLPN